VIIMRALSFKLAAIVSFIVAVAVPFVLRASLEPGHVISTGAGQWHHTTLTDGTALHVDARSRVNVEYTEEARIVTVDQGSAVFDVAHDPKRPFIARTHLIDATAVGTRFGVSIDRGVTTTVSEGIVKVTARGQHGSGTGILLKAGEELRVPEGGQDGPTHAKVNAERKLEWATGWLVFEGATIGEIVSELNRRNTVQIEIEEPEVAARRMLGFQRFRVDSSAGFARYIAEANDLSLTEERAGSVLRLRPKTIRGR
jgi:transmembrane sensor